MLEYCIQGKGIPAGLGWEHSWIVQMTQHNINKICVATGSFFSKGEEVPSKHL